MRSGQRPVPLTMADDSLNALVAGHYERLIRLAGLICRDRADTQDVVQIALARAWRHLGALRDVERVRPWIDRIVVREAIRMEHSRTARLSWIVRPQATEIALGHPTNDRDLVLRDAYRNLPTHQRAAIALHYFAGYSVAEVASLTDVPIETARSRLRLGRARLHAALGDETS